VWDRLFALFLFVVSPVLIAADMVYFAIRSLGDVPEFYAQLWRTITGR
jgi:hypothetical protein